MRSILILVLVLTFSTVLHAQNRQRLRVPTLSPQSEITQSVALTKVKLSYARPSARGRKIFGGLVPFGKIWRTGANASTKLTFEQDVSIGGNPLKAGTYALYTIPGEAEWTMIIHGNLKHRSLAGNVYKQAEDVFRFTAKPAATDKFVETFTISLDKIRNDAVDIVLTWENTRVGFGVNFDVNAQVDKQIAELFATEAGRSSFNYFRAAEYYLHNGRDLSKAVEWIRAALAKSAKNPRLGLLHAKILFKQGKKAEAIRVVDEANAWAKEQKNANYEEQTRVFRASMN